MIWIREYILPSGSIICGGVSVTLILSHILPFWEITFCSDIIVIWSREYILPFGSIISGGVSVTLILSHILPHITHI